MKINYNVTGAQRKSLVAAISQELNAPTKYLGMPTAAYEVGGYTIDKNGTLTGEDNVELVVNLDIQHGFKAVIDRSEEQNETAAETEDLDSGEAQHYPRRYADPNVPVTEEMLRQAEQWMEGQPEYSANTEDSLTIELPRDGFTDTAISNLEKLVESKSVLIKKAVGAESLTVEVTDDTLRFPWFAFNASADEVSAYTKFVSALCSMAKEQKRITAKEKPVDNEKYAFRCFLLRLGFIGDDYKTERKILLRNLSGNGSFKSGERLQGEVAPNGEKAGGDGDE